MNEQEQMMQIISAISEKTGEAPEKDVAMLKDIMQAEGQDGVKAFIEKILNSEAGMFKKGGKMEAAVNKFKCGGKTKKKVKKHANGEPITIPVNLDEIRTGTVTYNQDGTRKETILRTTDSWKGTAYPSAAVTHRVITPDSIAMYVQHGPVDEEANRSYLYNTARNMGAREKANQAKFDPMFNELSRRADFRITTLPNGKIVINDVVHTDNDTLSRTIDKSDTTIVNSSGDRFSNNSFRTKLFRKIFGTSDYDNANKNFEDIDFQQNGGIIKENIKLGKANYSGFEDLTGKYKRVAFPQDTTWVYRAPDGKMELTAMPTDHGYVGYKIEPGGDSRILTQDEARSLRDQVESRVKNIPHKNYLLNKYGDEMLLPENKPEYKVSKYLLDAFLKNIESVKQSPEETLKDLMIWEPPYKK